MTSALPKLRGYRLTSKASRGSEDHNIAISHRVTRRTFNIRALSGQHSCESILAPERAAAVCGERFFAEEWVPNGRIATAHCRQVRDVELPNSPTAAVAAIWKAADSEPRVGRHRFWPCFSGAGFGTRSIFYGSLTDALRAVQNAVESDVWLASYEPVRTKIDPQTGVEGSLETWAVIEGNGALLAFRSIVAQIQEWRQTGDQIKVGQWYGDFIYITVWRDGLEYPHCLRLGVTLDCLSKTVKTDGGLKFWRDGYAEIAQILTGGLAEYYGA